MDTNPWALWSTWMDNYTRMMMWPLWMWGHALQTWNDQLQQMQQTKPPAHT